MADEGKKFDIELGTKADTSGLEAAERALKAVETAGKAAANPMTDGSQLAAMDRQKVAAEQAAEATMSWAEAGAANSIVIRDLTEAEEDALKVMRDTDVQRAQALKAGREQAKVWEEIAASSRRLVAIQLAANLNQVAQEFRGVSKETDAVLDGLNAMAAGLMTGNPYVALGTAALSAGKMIVGAYKEAAAADAYYAQAVVDGQRQIEQALEAKRIRGRKSFLEEYFAKGNAEMVEAMANLERLDRMLKAQRGADTSDREADQRAAVRGGADPLAVDRADITADQQDALNELRAQVAAAATNAEQAKIRADELQAEFKTKQADVAFDNAAVEAARQAAEQAKVDAETAVKEAETRAFIASQESAEILNGSLDRLAENAAGENKAMVGKVEEAVKIIEASGKELNAAQQAALDRSKGALADGKLTASEQQQFTTDLQGTLLSVRTSNKDQAALLGILTDVTEENLRATAALADTAAQLKRDVLQLRESINRQ